MCLTGRNHLSCDEEGKPVSINCLLAPKPRPEMESVRLTRRELVGLSLIVDHVQRLPLAKRGCPDLLRDPNALLQDASVGTIINLHWPCHTPKILFDVHDLLSSSSGFVDVSVRTICY